MKNLINRQTIVNTSLGLGVAGICASFVIGLVAVYVKGPTDADYQRRTEARLQIESTESAMGSYLASLNITDPQAGIEAALAYCKNPTPVGQQKNAEHLCNTLVPKLKSSLEETATANAIINEKINRWGPFVYGGLAIGAVGIVLSLIGGFSIDYRSSKLQEKPAA